MSENPQANTYLRQSVISLPKYVAFLRGINVGGKNLVKMDALRKGFETAGFWNLVTLKASGNVVFESDRLPKSTSIQDSLKRTLGVQSDVLLRKFEEIVVIVRDAPFKKIKEPDVKFYVTFMAETPANNLEIPLVSSRGDVEIFSQLGLVAFSVSRRVEGRSGFPNLLLEAKSGVACTTRDWNTVMAISLLK
jgi:uncharacterized protein (DUF1697 family)